MEEISGNGSFVLIGVQLIGWSITAICVVYFVYKKLKNEEKEDFENREN